MPGPLVIPAVMAGSQLLGQGINAISQSGINKKTRQWNEQMYARQRADALADWQRQNEYNSPAAQMQRYAELHPDELAAKYQRYKEKNQEKILELDRIVSAKYRATHPERVAASKKKYVVTRSGVRVSEQDYDSIESASDEVEHWKKIISRWPDGTKIVVEEYINLHSIPYNILYDRGFTSVGCAPCTIQRKVGEDEL